MISKSTINLSIDALRHLIKDKAWDAEHSLTEYGDRCRKQVERWQKAIDELEKLKNRSALQNLFKNV